MLAAQADIDNNQASTKDWIGLNPWWTVLPTIIATKRGIIMLAKIAVADYMSKHPVTVKPETDVSTAIRTMLEHKVTSVPVVDERGKLLGIFSEKDGMKVVVEAAYNQSMAGKVSDFMTQNPTTVGPEESLVDVAAKFQNTPIRSFPVFQNDALVGMISRVDVLRALLS
jgi:CBS domain-containing protein